MELIKENCDEKNYEIKINNEEYILNLGLNKDKNKISIIIRAKKVSELNYYKLEKTYDELISSNKYLNALDSLEEIKEELDKIFSEQKNTIFNFQNDKKSMKINIGLTFGTKIKTIELLLDKVELSIDIIFNQNEKIKEQEIKIKKLEDELQEYKINNNTLKKILE